MLRNSDVWQFIATIGLLHSTLVHYKYQLVGIILEAEIPENSNLLQNILQIGIQE